MSEWISVKDRLPEMGEMIVYSSGISERSCIGRFVGFDDPLGPIPSCPNWLSWEDVKYWMPLPEFPGEYVDERL